MRCGLVPWSLGCGNPSHCRRLDGLHSRLGAGARATPLWALPCGSGLHCLGHPFYHAGGIQKGDPWGVPLGSPCLCLPLLLHRCPGERTHAQGRPSCPRCVPGGSMTLALSLGDRKPGGQEGRGVGGGGPGGVHLDWGSQGPGTSTG